VLTAGCGGPATTSGKIVAQQPTAESLRSIVQHAVIDANLRAENIKKQVFVDQAAISRYISFCNPGQEPDEIDLDNAIEDTYARAWQVTYRYSIQEIGPISTIPGEGSFSHKATIKLRITCEVQTGLARDEKPLPKPPEGKIVASTWSLPIYHYGLYDIKLPNLRPPARSSTTASTTLARQAVEKVKAARPQKDEKTRTIQAYYWTDKRIWAFDVDPLLAYLWLPSLNDLPPDRDGLTTYRLIDYSTLGHKMGEKVR